MQDITSRLVREGAEPGSVTPDEVRQEIAERAGSA